MTASEAKIDGPRLVVVDTSNEPRSDGEAERMYEEALQKGLCAKERSDVHYNLGNVLQRLGRAEAAESQYRACVAARPDHVEAWNNLAVALLRRGAYEEACEAARSGLGAGASVELETNLGLALEHAGHGDEARAAYERAIAASGERDPRPLTNLGSLLNRAGDVEKALEAHRAAARLAPDDADSHFNVAATLDDLGRLDEAVREYEAAVRLRPSFAEAHNNLGTALEAQERWEEAATHLERACALDDTDYDFACNLGNFRWRVGDLQAALAAFEKALLVAPAAYEANLAVAELHAASGHIDAALKHAKLAVAATRSATPAERDAARGLLEDLLIAWRDTLELDA